MFYSQEAEDHENDIRFALKEKRERDRQEEIETLRSLVRATLAALSQKQTYQTDVDYARNLCQQALMGERGEPIKPMQKLLQKKLTAAYRHSQLLERAASEHGCTCDACLNIARSEMLLEMTIMLDEHPTGYEGPCLCKLCRCGRGRKGE